MAGFGIVFVLSCFALCHSYDLGIKSTYNYATTVTAAEECGSSDLGPKTVGHQLRAKVHLTSVWQNPQSEDDKLIKMEVTEPIILVAKKGTYEKQPSNLKGVMVVPTYFHWNQGAMAALFETENESLDMKNLKRGIASLIQFQNTEEVISQSDVAGECQVLHKLSGKNIRKMKGNCIHSDHDESTKQASGVRSGVVFQTSTASCERANNQSPEVVKCSSKDNVKVLSNIWRKPSLCIISDSYLEMDSRTVSSKETITGETFEDALSALKASHKETLVESTIHSVLRNVKDKKVSSKAITTLLSSYQESLKTSKLAKLKSASVFLKLLPQFRAASKEDIVNVRINKEYRSIMPQIVDLIAACGSENCLNAAFETFDFAGGNFNLIERYLIGLSVSPRTSLAAIRELLVVLEKPKTANEKIKSAVLATLGSLLKVYKQQLGSVDEKVILDGLSYIKTELKKCKRDECKLPLLRGLRNAEVPDSAPLLIEEAKLGGRPALEAVLALKHIFQRYTLPKEFEDGLKSLFNQIGKKQDRSTRSVAAGILLSHRPSREVLKDMLVSLSDQSDPEFATFLASKITQAMESDSTLRHDITELLLDKDIKLYYSLTQKGASSLFKRLLADVTGLNVTYGTEMEMLTGGLLKRSSFDVEIFSPEGRLNLLSVGMFAEGLSSMAGVDSDDSPDESSPTAGMELSFLGSALRPYVFFTSTSEVMSHVWAGTASELTPALQGNSLVTDDARVVVLSNGMPLHIQLAAVLSLDLSGAIQVSLWNRNSQSQVQTSGALLVKGSARVESDLVSTGGEFSFMAQSALNFNSGLEFYEAPFKMCVQMEQPEFLVRREIQRFTTIPGTKFLVKKKTKRKLLVPAHSYALNRKNDEQCRVMLS